MLFFIMYIKKKIARKLHTRSAINIEIAKSGITDDIRYRKYFPLINLFIIYFNHFLFIKLVTISI